MTMSDFIIAAGVGQLLVVLGSLAIPAALQWRQQLAALRPLTRQVFWTYAGYIWCTNLFFAVVSLLIPAELTGETPLALAVCLFISLYWAARVVIQFVYFDRSDAPQGRIYLWAEWFLVSLFIAFATVYGMAAWQNWKALY